MKMVKTCFWIATFIAICGCINNDKTDPAKQVKNDQVPIRDIASAMSQIRLREHKRVTNSVGSICYNSFSDYINKRQQNDRENCAFFAGNANETLIINSKYPTKPVVSKALEDSNFIYFLFEPNTQILYDKKRSIQMCFMTRPQNGYINFENLNTIFFLDNKLRPVLAIKNIKKENALERYTYIEESGKKVIVIEQIKNDSLRINDDLDYTRLVSYFEQLKNAKSSSTSRYVPDISNHFSTVPLWSEFNFQFPFDF